MVWVRVLFQFIFSIQALVMVRVRFLVLFRISRQAWVSVTVLFTLMVGVLVRVRFIVRVRFSLELRAARVTVRFRLWFELSLVLGLGFRFSLDLGFCFS